MTKQTEMLILRVVIALSIVGIIGLFYYASGATRSEVKLSRWPSNTTVKVYTVRDSFGQDQPRIVNAVEAWRPFLPDGIAIQFAGDVDAPQSCAGCVTFVREKPEGGELGLSTLYAYEGLTTHALVRITPGCKGGDLQSVAEHEIGHVLGLPHRPNSVMKPRTAGSLSINGFRFGGGSHPRPDETDAEQLRMLYAEPARIADAVPPAPPILVSLPEPEIVNPPVPAPATAQRYQFKRIVILWKDGRAALQRWSTFTFNDKGEQVEVEIVQTGKTKGVDEKFWRDFPTFPIQKSAELPYAPAGYYVAWADENAEANETPADRFRSDELPWFAEKMKSGLTFPIYAESRDGAVSVRFYNYKVFRTSVTVTPMF